MSSVQLTHTARALSAVHCACVKTESECRKEAKADMESFEGGGVWISRDPNEKERVR